MSFYTIETVEISVLGPTEAIIPEYIRIVESLNTMFRVMGERSEVEGWRFNGVGSCRPVNKLTAELGLVGPARDRIIELRESLNSWFAGSSTISDCPYHRDNFGCTLGSLKGPNCTAHIDYPDELKERFGINGRQLDSDIFKILQAILFQNPRLSEEPQLFDATPGEFFYLALEAIDDMTQYVATFPILKESDQVKMLAHRRSNPQE